MATTGQATAIFTIHITVNIEGMLFKVYMEISYLEMMLMFMFMVLKVNYKGQYFEEDMKDESEEN